MLTTLKEFIATGKATNKKAFRYLDLQAQHPVFSGKHIDAGVNAQRHMDALSKIIRQAYDELSPEDYYKFTRSIVVDRTKQGAR